MKINWGRLLFSLSAIAYCQALWMICRAMQDNGTFPPGQDLTEARGFRVMFIIGTTAIGLLTIFFTGMFINYLTSGHHDSPTPDEGW